MEGKVQQKPDIVLPLQFHYNRVQLITHPYLSVIFEVLPTILVQVGHFGVSELGSDVGIPQQPLQDEHGQAQRVVVALQ